MGWISVKPTENRQMRLHQFEDYKQALTEIHIGLVEDKCAISQEIKKIAQALIKSEEQISECPLELNRSQKQTCLRLDAAFKDLLKSNTVIDQGFDRVNDGFKLVEKFKEIYALPRLKRLGFVSGKSLVDMLTSTQLGNTCRVGSVHARVQAGLYRNRAHETVRRINLDSPINAPINP